MKKNNLLANLGLLSIVVIPLCLGFWITTAPQDLALARSSQLEGLYVFTDATPVQPYDYLGSVQNGLRLAGSAQYQPVRDRLIKKIRDQFPAADGVIFHFVNNAPDKADAIKFK